MAPLDLSIKRAKNIGFIDSFQNYSVSLNGTSLCPYILILLAYVGGL
jgi:hypothetical protein